VIGHLGTRVSALLDGQLSPADEERAWEHVHTCHQCRDAVEREGWVKTRLASMQYAGSAAPSSLKGSLLVHGLVADWDFPEHPALAGDSVAARRRHLGLTGIGSGAVGAAVMGVLALGASPANAPGAVVQPSGDSFGNALTSVITAVIDRDRGADATRRPEAHSQRAHHSVTRTLTP
jgi:hypothetical protein